MKAVLEDIAVTNKELIDTGKVVIGVLGLQGDFQKHIDSLQKIENVDAKIVRTPDEIAQCDGLIIPGGESTAVGKLMDRFGVDKAIRECVANGMTIFGTCTGMILLAKEIEGSDQHRLGLMDITVRRNAFGRQVDSFESDIVIPEVGPEPVRAIFIRAPYITEIRENAKALYTLENGEVIFVRQGNCLAAAFHPELTEDTRVHKYFVNMTMSAKLKSKN